MATVLPMKPPVAAFVVNAEVTIVAIASPRTSAFMIRMIRQPMK